MDALISLVYTIIDSVCVCLFLDAFASHRWKGHRFLVGVIVQTILMYASIEFSVIAYRTKARDLSSPSLFSMGTRERAGTAFQKINYQMLYTIYVRKADYERAVHVILA